MRMIVLALLVFVMAGISLGVSRFEWSDYTAHFGIVDDQRLAFEPLPETLEIDDGVSLVRARPQDVMLLNNAVSTQTAHYEMLQDAAITSGVLQLRATSQISDTQASLLRVLVGNQTRGEVLLRPGLRAIDTEIGLTSEDLASDTLSIRYVLSTPETDGSCSDATRSLGVVEIEQDSRVILDVESGNLTARDQVAAWGNVVLVGWPSWLPEDQRAQRATLALQLAVLGYQVRFEDAPNSETMSVAALEELITTTVPEDRVENAMPEWPETVALFGSNAGLRTFHGSATWRHWYRIGAPVHTSAPLAFEYELLLGPAPDTSGWVVTVSHNGSVLDFREVPSTTREIRGVISLEDVPLTRNNALEITASSNYETTGLCNNGPELFAELRPATRLTGGGEDLGNALEDLQRNLMQRQPVTVNLPTDLPLVDMQRMLDLVAQLTPQDHPLRFVDGPATLTAVRRTEFQTAFPELPPSAYVAWLDQDGGIAISQVADFGSEETQDPSGRLALIVDLAADARQSALSDLR